jgi:hypothetical protein
MVRQQSGYGGMGQDTGQRLATTSSPRPLMKSRSTERKSRGILEYMYCKWLVILCEEWCSLAP